MSVATPPSRWQLYTKPSQSTSTSTVLCVQCLAPVLLDSVNAPIISTAATPYIKHEPANIIPPLNKPPLRIINPRSSLITLKSAHTHLKSKPNIIPISTQDLITYISKTQNQHNTTKRNKKPTPPTALKSKTEIYAAIPAHYALCTMM